MISSDIVKSIIDEITICYIALGRKVPDGVAPLAASFAEAIPFTIDEVHETFKRAKMVEQIPTQKTLYEAWKNYHEEFVKYREANSDPALEYDDPRARWLPKDYLKKCINYREAIKNYSIAIGRYDDFVRAHLTTKVIGSDNKPHVTWVNPQARSAYDKAAEPILQDLYTKYIRKLPLYATYPATAKLNLALIPPSVQEFEWMLEQESKNTQQG